jgi:LuxR family transcriptional regulator, maltose regulon positive regulatory protein
MEPPKKYASFLANQALKVLNFESIKLTLEETQEFVQNAGYYPTPEAVTLLHQRTDGWAAGLVLLIEHARRLGITLRVEHGESVEALFEFFATEAVATLPQPIQEFLSTTAFLPHMTSEMAKAISGNPMAETILETLRQRQFFIDRRDAPNAVYQYHALLRECLLHWARQLFDVNRVNYLCVRAAELMEENGAPEEAVALYFGVAEFEMAARLILREAPGFFWRSGRSATVNRWILQLPEDMTAKSGWLLFWLGISQSLSDLHAARKTLSLLSLAHTQFVREEDTVGRIRVASEVVLLYCALERKSLRPIDFWLSELEQLVLAVGADVPFDALYDGLTATIIGLYYRAPGSAFLAECASRLMKMLEDAPPDTNSLRGAVVLSVYYRWMGDIDNGAHLVRIVEPWVNLIDDTLPKAYWWMVNAVSRCQLLAEHGTDAEGLFHKGIALIEAEGIQCLIPMIQVYQLNMLLSRGELRTASMLADTLNGVLDSAPGLERANFHAFRAHLALLKSDPLSALEQAEKTIAIGEEAGWKHMHCIGFLAAAIANVERMAFEEAQVCILNARLNAAGHFLQFNVNIVEAYLGLLVGDHTKASSLLSDAFRIGRICGYRNCWFWVPKIMAKVCVHAIEHGIETEYAENLIRYRELQPPSRVIQTWPWAVRIYMFGAASILIDNEALRFQGKAQRKPLELLKATLACGGCGVDQGALIERLWPELDGDAGRNAFDLALHRLRKLFGLADFIQLQDRKLWLNTNQIWTDVWAFEHLCESSEQGVIQKLATSDLEVLARRLLNTYSGHFLEGEEAPWAIAARQRLSNKFLIAVSSISKRLELEGFWETATSLYHRAIEIEPLEEEFYRRLMISYRNQGRTAEAMNAYRRCRDLLSVTLGIEPAIPTKEIFRLLQDTVNLPRGSGLT